jgi:hypothetical protein
MNGVMNMNKPSATRNCVTENLLNPSFSLMCESRDAAERIADTHPSSSIDRPDARSRRFAGPHKPRGNENRTAFGSECGAFHGKLRFYADKASMTLSRTASLA